LATGPAWNAASADLAMASQKERQFLAASAAQQGLRQHTGQWARAMRWAMGQAIRQAIQRSIQGAIQGAIGWAI
jgi:hypothetical protein